MAKSELYGQSPSQQQTSSPRKVKPAVSEPELVAGQEVVGREISVFQGSVKNPEWWDGKVMEFNPDSAQHLIRYHKAHSSEEWLQLSGQPFQWKGSPASGAAPNPTVRGIKLNDSILGRKVKVFWPTMCKWYLGSIKEYDPHSSRHTIKYKDGEVKDHALRNEAVWWLDVSPGAKVTSNSSRSRGQSTSSRGGSPDARLPGKKQSRSTGRTSGGSSDRRRRQQHSTTAETSHRSQTDTKSEAVPAAQADTAGPHISAAQTEARPRVGAETSGDADRDCHSGIFAAASGNADTDAENGYASQHSQRQDPAGASPPAMQDEEEQTQDHVPRQASNPAAKPSRMATLRQGRSRDWTRLAEDTKGVRSRAVNLKGGEGRGVLDEPGAGEAIIGARVGIFWEDDETFYKGQLAGFDAYHKRSKVCYDDGQEEWISLSKERFRWFTPRGCTSKHFNPRMKSVMTQLEAIDIPAGSVTLPQPSVPTQTVVSEVEGRASNADSASTRQLAGTTAVPQGAAAVGWGLSIYSQAEEVWVRGEVISWNSRQGQYHVLYEDGEDEWLRLAKENVQWHSSRSTISETAGLQKGRRVPQGLAAVGWRIGVYWREDHKFYLGELASYNDEEDLYEMNYDDNEKEDIFLTEQPIKWLLPPGLSTTGGASGGSTTGEPPEAPSRPKRSTSNSDPSVKFKRQPSSRRLAQDRGLEKQRSRLGVTRRGSAIQKVTAAAPKTALLSALPHTSTSPAILPSHDAYPASAAAVAPAAAIASTSAATAVAGADSAITGKPLAVASRVPPPARLGSSSTPHIDRVIALGSRRAPHLAGTRVKIYCSQGGRGIKSRRSACELGSDSTTSRRVRQKVEALDLMIWRCECARKVITTGAPIPVSTLSGPDVNKPPTLLQSVPVAGLIANQVAARLGATQSLPTNFCAGQLPPSSTFSGSYAAAAPQLPVRRDQDMAEHLPTSSQQEAGHQLQLGRQVSPDAPELIHQLPSSAPMLAQDDHILFRHSAPEASDAQQHVRAGGLSPTPSQRKSPSPAVSTGYSPGRQAGALSRSPSISLPANPSPNPMGSRHSSPGSASLAGLIPSTTAVTVPSPHSHAPYSVISAARAAIVSDHTVPVVTIQDAHISLPATLPSTDNAKSSSAQLLALEPPVSLSDVGQQRPLAKLPALNKALRMQDSVGIPDTPDSESLEHHAALNRERSSFSKTTSMDGVQQDSAAASLQRKGMLSTSGLLDLAMSDALPAADVEPDMFAAFFADSGAFSDKPDSAVSLPLHDASKNNA